MKSENHVTASNQSGPACADVLTEHEKRVAASVTVGTFVRRYPASAVGDKMRRVTDVLAAYYVAHGFNVRGCSSWNTALRRIIPGEVWLVWSEGADLRVIGMMKGGNRAPLPRGVAREFMRRVRAVGNAAKVDAITPQVQSAIFLPPHHMNKTRPTITAEQLVEDAAAKKPFTIKRGDAPEGFLEVRHDDLTRPTYHVAFADYQRLDGLIDARRAKSAGKNLGIIAHAGPIDDLKNRGSFDAIIDAEDAHALAQFLKRVTFSTCERHATGQDEAHRMMQALEALRRVVNDAGFNPR